MAMCERRVYDPLIGLCVSIYKCSKTVHFTSADSLSHSAGAHSGSKRPAVHAARRVSSQSSIRRAMSGVAAFVIPRCVVLL